MSSRPSRTGRVTPPRAPRRRRAGAPPLPELPCPLLLPSVCSHHGLKKDGDPPPRVPSLPAPGCSTMSSWMRRRHQFFPLRRRGWGPCSAVPPARDRAEEATSQGRRPRRPQTLEAAASAEFHSVGSGFPWTTRHSASTLRSLNRTSIVGSWTSTLCRIHLCCQRTARSCLSLPVQPIDSYERITDVTCPSCL